jgi:integrase
MFGAGDLSPHVTLRRGFATPTESQVTDFTHLLFGSASYTATAKKAESGGRNGWQARYAELHDFVLFMANTGLRPDEALRLEFRDVVIEKDYATKQTILVIDVRGKTGVGYCKSMPGAVFPFERLRKRREEQLRNPPKVWPRRSRSDKPTRHRALPAPTEPRDLLPTDRLFPSFNRDAFNAILEEQGLKHDRDGRVRTAYSLRHTYNFHAPHGGRGHLSDRQQLPHQRANDRAILRCPHQGSAGYRLY